jgi:hypothetical protein
MTEAEQLEIVVSDTEALSAADAAVERLERAPAKQAAVHVLDAAASSTDEVMVVTGELLRELETTDPAGGVGRAEEAELGEEMHGSVHGDEVDAPLLDPFVDLRRRERGGLRDEDVEHGAPGTREAEALAGECGRNVASRVGGGGHIENRLQCIRRPATVST